ncbi:hypothetical protein CRP9_gp39 [Roseobacter phage CRP-9]|nr:hypothetical protein CRP9_gp39 [Roseobacter phage CRP-9]
MAKDLTARQRKKLERQMNSIAESILGDPTGRSSSSTRQSLMSARGEAARTQAGMREASYGVRRALRGSQESEDKANETNEKLIAKLSSFIVGAREPSDTETPSLDWYNAQDIDSDTPYDPEASRPNLSTPEAQDEREEATDQNRAAGEGLPAFIFSGSEFRSAIADTEAESYDTMFGNAERVEGKFLGMELTAMPMSAIFDLTKLNGDFHKRNLELGHDTTAVGKYQFVGNTLRDLRDRGVLEELGITDDTIFDEKTQDTIAVYLVQRRVKPEYSLAKAREEMGKEWEGFKKLSVERQNAVIKEIRGSS